MGCQIRHRRDDRGSRGRQHGVVARSHLLQAGLTAREIQRRMSAGRLHTIHRGVYAVGHRVLTLEGRWMAATLACGPNAALSHTTAAAAADLRRADSAIHVTVPGRGGRQAPRGITLHRSPTLTPAQITTVPRHPGHDSRADDHRPRASRQRTQSSNGSCTRPTSAASWTSATSTSRDPPSLQAVLRAYDPAPTRSELERSLPKLCRRARNREAGGERGHRRLPSRLRLARPATSSSKSTATTTTAHRRSSSQTASRTSTSARAAGRHEGSPGAR